jgi:glycosyltransferase involved in cell wall biosynthesis
MKLLMICHMAVPHHNAGGETTIHAAFRELVNRGHEVHVACRPHTNERYFDDYVFEGVKVVRPPHYSDPYQWFRSYATRLNPDLILTHLDLTFTAEQLSLDIDIPLAHFVHNDIKPGFHRVTQSRCQLAIYNSNWVAGNFAYKNVPYVIVHPVIEPERYRCERGTKITFINPTPDKGADTFYALSKKLPHREFLVVKSVYGEQIAPPNINGANYPNVEVMEHTADVREAFKKSRAVLMPSIYESYGRVAVEAACAGIPAIVHPTEGLLEALGAERTEWAVEFARHSLTEHRKFLKWQTPEQLRGGWVNGAGIFCDRNDIDSWAAQIERLFDDEIYYHSRSNAALALADSLDPSAEYDKLESALTETVARHQSEREAGNVQMWISDRWIWKMQDGSYKAMRDQRIPVGSAFLFAGIGTEVPEKIARENGWIDADTKAIEGPAENKAIEAPAENKKKKKTA